MWIQASQGVGGAAEMRISYSSQPQRPFSSILKQLVEAPNKISNAPNKFFDTPKKIIPAPGQPPLGGHGERSLAGPDNFWRRQTKNQMLQTNPLVVQTKFWQPRTSSSGRPWRALSGKPRQPLEAPYKLSNAPNKFPSGPDRFPSAPTNSLVPQTICLNAADKFPTNPDRFPSAPDKFSSAPDNSS